MTGKEIDIIIGQLETQGTRLETLAGGLSEVATHCATLLERTAHLATRDEITSSIRVHVQECRASRVPRSAGGTGTGWPKLIKALAALLAVAAAALGSYLGLAS